MASTSTKAPALGRLLGRVAQDPPRRAGSAGPATPAGPRRGRPGSRRRLRRRHQGVLLVDVHAPAGRDRHDPGGGEQHGGHEEAAVDQHGVVAPAGDPGHDAQRRDHEVQDPGVAAAAVVGELVRADEAGDVEVGRAARRGPRRRRWPWQAGSSAIAVDATGPGRPDLCRARRQRLGQHPHLGHRRHEVGVAVPAGQRRARGGGWARRRRRRGRCSCPRSRRPGR